MGKKKNGGYGDHFQHIEDMAERLSVLLEVRTLEKELRSLKNSGTDEELKVVRGKLTPLKRKLGRLDRLVDSKVRETLERGEVDLPLYSLSSDAGLCPLETRILEMLLCMHACDELCERACELSGSRKVQIRTVLDVLGESLEEKTALRGLLHPGSRLLKGGAVLAVDANRGRSEAHLLETVLNLSSRVYSILMGQDAGNRLLGPFSEVVSDGVALDELVLPEDFKGTVLGFLKCREFHGSIWEDWGLESVRPFRKGTVLALSGPEGSGRRTLACSLAGAIGKKCFHVRMDKVLKDSDNPVDICREIFTETEYQGALFSGRNTSELETFKSGLVEHDGVTIMTISEKADPAEALDGCVVWRVEMPMPGAEERQLLWRRLLPEGAPLAEDVDLPRLAMEYELTPGSIQEAIIGASLRSLARGNLSEGIRQEDLAGSSSSCIDENRRRSDRNRRMTIPFRGREESDSDGQEGYFDTEWSSVSMEDVVLPSRTRRQVMDIIAAAHHQEKVFEEWGFGDIAGSGHSISALFKGESGTGKTMTAEALAHELKRKLCTVRGSSVISKWVGESEKNIVRVFRESGENEVVFFDEADSIFTSRIEQDDSHAEMINRRISCLLREIELFRGVIILATNYPGLIDGAFQRRIRFMVDFPRPDGKAREAIWRINVPEKVPLADDVDFGFLAEEFDFTGGQIRSIILRAAFAAAGRGSEVDRELLLQAAGDEIPFVRRKEMGFSD